MHLLMADTGKMHFYSPTNYQETYASDQRLGRRLIITRSQQQMMLCGSEERLGTSETLRRDNWRQSLMRLEHALNDVACFIELGVVFELHLAVSCGAGYRLLLQP